MRQNDIAKYKICSYNTALLGTSLLSIQLEL